MSDNIEENLKFIYKAMLNMYPLSFEEFKTKNVEQDETFQGVGIILTEGLYAFENLNFEEQITEETLNDNQNTTVSENETTTSTY